MVGAMIRPIRLFGLILLAGASLTSCNKQDASDAPVPNQAELTVRSSEDQFGEGFGNAFRADPNSEPSNVMEGDVVPVSQTAEPVQID